MPDTVMQLFVSRKLYTDLKAASFQENQEVSVPNSWVWYAHRIIVNRRKWIIAMEAYSRFAVLLPNVTKIAFVNFEKILSEQIMFEASRLCKLPPEKSVQLTVMTEELSGAMCLMEGLDRSVQAHIKDVAHVIEYLYYRENLSPENALEVYIDRINGLLRKTSFDQNPFRPNEKWKEMLLEQLAKQAQWADEAIQLH